MKRRPTTQDISWFLDLHNNSQLNLDPPYQRRSVWTTKDRKFFLDTIFRDYPCPAIFLHKETSEDGKIMYHVVDGKQRLETIILFVNNKIAIAKDFGDKTLAGKKWKNLQNEPSLKKRFWDYVLSVEFIDTIEGLIVNDVFDRLNRNARKLERQEMRHAKYDGWFISTAEAEAEKDEWETLGVATKARVKRMKDVQFISELLIILLKDRIDGFDQDYLDETYAEFDDPQETSTSFSEEEFHRKLSFVKNYILEMEKVDNVVTTFANGFGNFLSLWAVVALNENQLPSAKKAAKQYQQFMTKVDKLLKEKDPDEFFKKHPTGYGKAYRYYRNSVQASTDQPQRQGRHEALKAALIKAKG
jgi:hypothetical protein